MKRILLGSLFGLFFNLLFSQQADEANIRELVKFPVPPSPNAAALGKFGEIQVGLATGIPSISVPMFQWQDKLKELSVDVSLSYHAGGHKVQDLASNCGLGWALNAGGVISRTTRGVPDDGPGGYLNTPPVPNKTTNPITHMYGYPTSSNDGVNDSNYGLYDSVFMIAERTVDGEFDIFNISAGGISNKFFIDKNGAINFLTQTNIVVTYERYPSGAQNITKFKLVDERGITYLFDVLESTDSQSENELPGAQPMACATSFFMSKMISADKKDTVKYSYDGPVYLYYEGGFSESGRITHRAGTYQVPSTTYSHSINSTTYSKRISLIEFPDSTNISFAYSFARADYDGDHALTSVTISNGSVSRKFNLSYDYFSTAYDPSAGEMYSDNDYTKRLKLLQVQQISGTDTLPPHIFEYNSQNLPPRNSKAVDHWGYYNGVSNNTFLPTLYIPESVGVLVLSGANKEPVEQYTKASVLEKIIYPTGGSTKFTYHINDVNMPYYNNAYETDYVYGLDENEIGNYVSLPFSGRTNDTVSFSVQLINNLPPPENEPWSGDCPVTITVKSTDNTVTETINTIYEVPVIESLVLPTNKTYQVKFETECASWLEDYYISFEYIYEIEPTNKNVGGLRVERIEDNDSVGNKIITDYSYVTVSNTSSGKLQNLPNYSASLSTTREIIGGNNSIDDFADYHWIRTATPEQSLTYFRGSPVIYTRVKVKKYAPTTDIGYSIHEFSDFQGSSPDSYFPFRPTQAAEWSQGLELRDSIFNSSNQLVKRTEKEWDDHLTLQDSAKSRNMITALMWNDYDETAVYRSYATKVYNMFWGRAELKKMIDVVYNGSDSLRTVTTYFYDPNKFVLTKQRTLNSKGDSLETRFFYPHNYNFETDDAFNTVISKETWKKKSNTWYLTGGLVNEYDEFNSSFIKQKKIIAAEILDMPDQTAVGSFDPSVLKQHSSFEDQVEFVNYDSKGRYTEISTRNNPPTSFIWSLYPNFPIAKVSNATSTNIAYSSFETLDKGNWTYSGTTTVHPSAPTGTKGYSLAGGNISKSGLVSGTIYTVTFWKKDSSSSVSFSNGSGTSLVTKNGWILYTYEFTGATSLTISGTAYIDELRLYPKGAMMETYTYQPINGLSTQCDINNRITYYQYDGFGRLKRIKDEDGRIVKLFEYKYKASYQQ